MNRWIRRSVHVVLAALLTSLGAVVAISSPASAAATATAETVVYWNNTLLEAFRRQGGSPTPLARAAAIVHGGIFDLLNSAKVARQGNSAQAYLPYAYHPFRLPVSNFDDNLAAGMVARDLIIFALPAQQAFAQQKFTQRHGSTSQATATTAAAEIVTAYRDARANDGSNAPATYTFDNVPGAWRLTGHLCPAPATPQWGRVKRFWVNTTLPPLPAGATTYASLLTSSQYTANFNEVKALGRSNSTTRTAEQTRIAWFWANDLDGTYKPPGQLLEHTRIVASARYGTAALETARIFAMASIAMADAAVVAWNRKFDTPVDLWRPETAIQLAATDNNPNTAPVDGWRPLSADRNNIPFSPCFPAWVSGHATFAGAWAAAMRSQFGDNVTFTATTEDPHAVGVTRTFTSFTAAARENARSRIYLGVHYQFDADDGITAGTGVGDAAGRLLGPYTYEPCTPTTC